MSADNFIQIREFDGKYWYANLSASQYWGVKDWHNLEIPRKEFIDGPFDTEDAAWDHADKNVHIIEYDIVVYEERMTQGKVNEGTAKLKALINKWAVYKGDRQ